jgi:hypothetical protein
MDYVLAKLPFAVEVVQTDIHTEFGSRVPVVARPAA